MQQGKASQHNKSIEENITGANKLTAWTEECENYGVRIGRKLWFDELMKTWQNWHNVPAWEDSLLQLLARLAEDNVGYIDWEPCIPMIFTRLLRTFNLPGRPGTLQVYRASAAFDTIIASMLGMGNSCQLHLTRLFKALESFYHPSNHGRWLVKMQKLLQRLLLAVTKQLHRLYSSLETLTELHRLTADLHCIVPVCSLTNIFLKASHMSYHYSRHLYLELTLMTFGNACAVEIHPDLPQNIQDVCLSTAIFEDFVLQFMDRCFALVENSCFDNHNCLDRDSERKNPEEQFMEIGLYSTFGLILMQCSPAIYEVALSKLQTFVTSHILEINISGKYAANMCRVACRINPELGLKLFLPHFSKLVLALTEADDIINEEKLDDELLFSLLILSEIVRSDGKHVHQYHSSIVKVLERTLNLKCKEGLGYCWKHSQVRDGTSYTF